MNDDPFEPIAGGKPRLRVVESEKWRLIVPVPVDAPAPPKVHPKLGAPSATWAYLDATGAALGFTWRFDGESGKQFRPVALYAPAAGGAPVWRWEAWPTPRPLYGLDRLAARPRAPVVVAEGEKSAAAAARLLPGFVAITSPNGSKSAAKADWTPLRGRAVTIWPDADAPGLDYAQKVAELAQAAGAASVAIVAPPDGVAAGWDAADAEAEGLTPARAEALISAAAPVAPPSASETKAGKSKSERRRPQRDALMSITKDWVLWHGPDGEAFASIPIGDHRENWPIRSQVTKRRLAVGAWEQDALAPGAQAIEDTIRVLEARAVSEGEERSPWRRVGARDGRLYVDLADAAWRAIEIRSAGWGVVDGSGLPFIRSPRMRPLCAPAESGSIDELRRFANVETGDDFVLVVAWLVAAFRQRGPYPILLLNGQQGTGKSSFTRLLRSLVDPSSPAIQGPPKDEQNLIVTAQNSHVIGFDNLSHVDATLSDGLCRLATGSGFAVRALHTDKDENVFDGARPLILNGIPSLAERPDLNERSIGVRLVTIDEDRRRPEDEIEAEWEQARPRVLAALCDALSSALHNISTTRLSRSGRMADFEKWMTAAEPGLDWIEGTFSAAYSRNRNDSADAAFEGDIVATSIRDFLAKDDLSYWSGTPTELLDKIGGVVNEATRQMRLWPKTAQGLGNCLERSAPLLRAKGIVVERRKSGVRTIILTRMPEPASPRAPSA